MDTSERDRALNDLEKEKGLRQKAELETAQMRLLYQKALDDCRMLKQELDRHKNMLRYMETQYSTLP